MTQIITDGNVAWITTHPVMTNKIREIARSEAASATQRLRSDLSTPNFLEGLLQDLRLKDAVSQLVPALVDTRVRQILPNELDQRVSGAIFKELPTVLKCDSRLNEILASHCTILQRELEQKGRGIMDMIVNDPNYHALTSEHLATMKRQHDQESKEEMLTYRRKADSILDQCKREMTDELQALKKKVVELEESNGMAWFFLFGVCILCSVGLYFASSTYYVPVPVQVQVPPIIPTNVLGRM
jgi:hypothetical protein